MVVVPGANSSPAPVPDTQCAAVTMRLPAGLETTLAVQVCIEASPAANSGPTVDRVAGSAAPDGRVVCVGTAAFDALVGALAVGAAV